jgi:hypothetical protein
MKNIEGGINCEVNIDTGANKANEGDSGKEQQRGEGWETEKKEGMKDIKGLVFGNSLFERNGQSQMIADIAASLDDKFSLNMLAPDNSHLQWHGTDKATFELIKSNPGDIMILQERGEDMARGGKYADEYILPYAKRIIKSYRQINPEGRIILFQTWAGKNGEADIEAPEVGSYSEMQVRINKAYEAMARELKAQGIDTEIAPVGEAWNWVRNNYFDIELYTDNMKDPYKYVHPSRAGSYLSACVFYATIFGKSVIKASGLDIDSSQALILREAADKFALHRQNK